MVKTVGNTASVFLIDYYTGISGSIKTGMKVKAIRSGIQKRDINTAIQGGERMANNIIAMEALESGDEATIENMVTLETGVQPLKVQQGVTMEQVQVVVAESEAKNEKLFRKYLQPAPKKRGRKAKP